MGIFSFFGRRRPAESVTAASPRELELWERVLKLKEQVRGAQKGLIRLQKRNKRAQALRRYGIAEPGRMQTHYAGCWQEKGHHACAIERIKHGPDGWSVDAMWRAYISGAELSTEQRTALHEAFMVGVKVAAHESRTGVIGAEGCHKAPETA